MELDPIHASDASHVITEVGGEKEAEIATKSTTVNLDRSGDVILKVGDKSLLVSSKVMSLASPVFRVMFGPHFQEGDTLSKSNSSSPAVIPLPDDHALSMIFLCQALHFINDPIEGLEISQEVVPELRKLAMTCDKYDCVAAVSLHINTWFTTLESFESKASESELFSLLESAYILDHAAAFERVSKRILLNDTGQILDRIMQWTTDDVLPIKIYGELEKRRRDLHQELTAGLQEPIAHLIGKPECEPTTTIKSKQYGIINHTWHRFCLHDGLLVSAYIRELRRINLWPLDNHKNKLSSLLNAFDKFEDRDSIQAMGFGIFAKSPHCQACVLDTRSRLATLMGKVDMRCKGLCLDCMEKKSEDGKNGEEADCRIEHD